MKPETKETKITNQPPHKVGKEDVKKLVDDKKKQVKENQIIRK